MLEIAISVLLYTGILLVLTLLILWVRDKLVPKGEANVNVNETLDFKVCGT